MIRTLRTLIIIPLACLLLSGCRVSEHHNGNNAKVDIGTPFGSMHIKTDNTSDTSAIGLAAYPGAVPTKDSGDKDGNSTNIDLSFGSFHLGVKAASFQTPDSEDKVLAFYRKDLAARYGDVIECQDHEPVGSPTRTSEGLTCQSDRNKNHFHSDLEHNSDHLELRAGSEQHQHIVGVETRDGGTQIGLVALNPPSHLSSHDSKDIE